MPILEINLDDLIQALSSKVHDYDGGWYLDLETGQVLLSYEGEGEVPEDADSNPRYRRIGAISSHESFEFRQDFVDTIEDEEIREHLETALSKRKPFRHFGDAVCDFPGLRERWFEFEARAMTRYAKDWLEMEGIEAKLRDLRNPPMPEQG